MGDSKGGQSDSSGMMAAMASANAANMAYKFGEEQLQWAKDQWNQMQPLVAASTQAQIDYSNKLGKSLDQMQAESQAQWQEYQDYYRPLEEKFVGEAENWDSPSAIAQARGEAMADVGTQGMAGLNTAAEQLRAYGVNPGSERYASLYTSAQPMIGAAEAAAGTTAANNLRLQKMGLESGAINTGRGMVNTTGSLTNSGTSAGSAGSQSAAGAASTGFSNINTGSNAMTQPTNWFNTGATNMGVYTGSVNNYNQTQADFANAAATEMAGYGKLAGNIFGMFMPHAAKGGPINRYEDGGMVDDPTLTPSQGGGATGIPSQPIPPGGTPGGGVPSHASPSYGTATDDVPAMLTANEFVIPKDVATWKGHEYFAKQIDAARKGQQQFAQRDDIGGEPTSAIPQQPTFVSRPSHMGTTAGAIPGMA